MDKIDPTKRNCYCTLWKTNAEFLKERDIPYGYCGICACGTLGHLRHAPDGAYTDTFCDNCFDKLCWLNIARLGAVVIFFVSLFFGQYLFTMFAIALFGFTLFWRLYLFPNYQAKQKAKHHP